MRTGWREYGSSARLIIIAEKQDSHTIVQLDTLHMLSRRLCLQMPNFPHSQHSLLRRWCEQMLDHTRSLRLLFSRLYWQMFDPPQSLHFLFSLVQADVRFPAIFTCTSSALVLADGRSTAFLAIALSAPVRADARSFTILTPGFRLVLALPLHCTSALRLHVSDSTAFLAFNLTRVLYTPYSTPCSQLCLDERLCTY